MLSRSRLPVAPRGDVVFGHIHCIMHMGLLHDDFDSSSDIQYRHESDPHENADHPTVPRKTFKYERVAVTYRGREVTVLN